MVNGKRTRVSSRQLISSEQPAGRGAPVRKVRPTAAKDSRRSQVWFGLWGLLCALSLGCGFVQHRRPEADRDPPRLPGGQIQRHRLEGRNRERCASPRRRHRPDPLPHQNHTAQRRSDPVHRLPILESDASRSSGRSARKIREKRRRGKGTADGF
mgnify:CR=1 FL=1